MMVQIFFCFLYLNACKPTRELELEAKKQPNSRSVSFMEQLNVETYYSLKFALGLPRLDLASKVLS
jgi:hypothetical protein